jgi:hypothetical protein
MGRQGFYGWLSFWWISGCSETGALFFLLLRFVGKQTELRNIRELRKSGSSMNILVADVYAQWEQMEANGVDTTVVALQRT